MTMLWHYAPWSYLQDIVDSGELKGSNAAADRELPMLWFSANQQWEPTATKMIETEAGVVSLTFEQQADRFGCIRFGLVATDSRLLNWKNACTAAGTPREMRGFLEKAGKEKGGDPAHWFASIANIPLAELHFQVWLDGWHNAASPKDMAKVWTEARG